MKFWTLLLSTFVLFLAIKPALDGISFQNETEQSCCGGNCAPADTESSDSQNQNQDDDCSGKTCNPFQVCSSCVLLCLNIHFDYLPKPTISSKKSFTYQSFFISQFISDFWQPPEFV